MATSWDSLSSADGSYLTLITVLAFTVLWLLWSVSSYFRCRNRLPVPPGNFGFPFIGQTVEHVLAMSTADGIRMWVQKQIEKHGPLFKFRFAGYPMVMLGDEEGNKFIFQNDGTSIHTFWPSKIATLFGPHSLLLQTGERHKLLRRHFSKMFDRAAMSRYIHGVNRNTIRHFTNHWQPFMEMLKAAEVQGPIKGLRIQEGKSLLFQLFADDTGIFLEENQANFEELKAILERYELASGAKVNFSKTLVMPLGSSVVPEWIKDEECEVAEAGRAFRYLGVMTGVNIPEHTGVNDLLRRMQRRMMSWENHYLSWTARVVLIKHILSQIPSFILLVVGCSGVEAKMLTKMCREFLWGSTEEGKVRKALVAWKKFALPTSHGGLGFIPFEIRSQALLMRYSTALLDDKPVEWVWICKRWLRYKLLSGVYVRERKVWAASDALLLLDSVKIPEAPTVNRILKGWFSMRKKLNLDESISQLPSTLTVGALKIVVSSWRRENRCWTKLLLPTEVSPEELNRKWRCSDSSQKWKQRWDQLWHGASLLKHKVWIWRILQEGILTQKRTAKWGVTEKFCPYCQCEEESVCHFLWECRGIRERVTWLTTIIEGPTSGQVPLLDVLDRVLSSHSCNPGILMLFYDFSWATWKERNQLLFQGYSTRMPVRSLVAEWKITLTGVVRHNASRLAELVHFNSELLLFQVEEAVVIEVARIAASRRVVTDTDVEVLTNVMQIPGRLPISLVASQNSLSSFDSESSEDSDESSEEDESLF
ncbi:hypothetical protein R1sor_008610 [Riccia sorocarpa]|uniref:Reverse transcriptase zinc-binding domain-containing protein n=1 Tax=Riccia sorocarpa TaxID=122646 RepID=A0ABD3HW20_9MARC